MNIDLTNFVSAAPYIRTTERVLSNGSAIRIKTKVDPITRKETFLRATAIRPRRFKPDSGTRREREDRYFSKFWKFYR